MFCDEISQIISLKSAFRYIQTFSSKTHDHVVVVYMDNNKNDNNDNNNKHSKNTQKKKTNFSSLGL